MTLDAALTEMALLQTRTGMTVTAITRVRGRS